MLLYVYQSWDDMLRVMSYMAFLNYQINWLFHLTIYVALKGCCILMSVDM